MRKENKNVILKKKRLRAKKLLTSRDYLSDLEAWEKDRKARDSISITDYIEMSQSDRKKFKKLLNHESKLWLDISKKYKIPRPYSVEFLKEVVTGKTGQIENFFYRGLSPVRQVVLNNGRPPKLLQGLLVVSSNNRLIVEINPTANRKEIYSCIDEMLDICDSAGIKKEGRRFRDESFMDLDIWTEYLKTGKALGRQGFQDIAKILGLKVSRVKNGWYREYKKRYGEPYNLQKIKEKLGNKADELCSRCNDAKCYKTMNGSMNRIPCPDYLKLAGKEYQREKSMTLKQFHYHHFGQN